MPQRVYPLDNHQSPRQILVLNDLRSGLIEVVPFTRDIPKIAFLDISRHPATSPTNRDIGTVPADLAGIEGHELGVAVIECIFVDMPNYELVHSRRARAFVDSPERVDGVGIFPGRFARAKGNTFCAGKSPLLGLPSQPEQILDVDIGEGAGIKGTLGTLGIFEA